MVEHIHKTFSLEHGGYSFATNNSSDATTTRGRIGSGHLRKDSLSELLSRTVVPPVPVSSVVEILFRNISIEDAAL